MCDKFMGLLVRVYPLTLPRSRTAALDVPRMVRGWPAAAAGSASLDASRGVERQIG